jgi:PII-like signaling protein
MTNRLQAQVLSIYIGEQDSWHGGPLYAAIVARFRQAEIAGVTVLHGIEGYGGHRAIHTQRIEVLFQGLPVVVEAVDTPDRIATALAILDEMLIEGLVTVHDVTAIRYNKEPKA